MRPDLEVVRLWLDVTAKAEGLWLRVDVASDRFEVVEVSQKAEKLLTFSTSITEIWYWLEGYSKRHYAGKKRKS